MFTMSSVTKKIFIAVFFITCSGFVGLFGSDLMGLIGFSWKSHIPEEFKHLGFIKSEYKFDDTHFIGPSGIHEAFLVYSMSDSSVGKLEKEGLDYLRNLPSTKKYEQHYASYIKSLKNGNSTGETRAYRDNRIGQFKNWRATPIQENEERWNRRRHLLYPELVREGLAAEERWRRYHDWFKSTRGRYCTDSSLCSFYGGYNPERPGKKNSSPDRLKIYEKIQPEYTELINEILNSPNSFYGYGELSVLVVSPEHKKIFLLYRS